MVVFAVNAGHAPLTPLAEAHLLVLRTRSAAAASKHPSHSVRIMCRADRARFAPWVTGRPYTEHARWRTWRGCLRSQHGARSIPRRWPTLSFIDTASGRRLRLQSIVAAAFESRAVCPRALRPVENQPTAHGARARWGTWRGCLRGQHATRSTPRRWLRLFFTEHAPGQRLRLRSIVVTDFESRAARLARASPREEAADCPRSTRALADLAWWSCGQRGARSIPRRWLRLFFTDAEPGRQLRLQSLVTI